MEAMQFVLRPLRLKCSYTLVPVRIPPFARTTSKPPPSRTTLTYIQRHRVSSGLNKQDCPTLSLLHKNIVASYRVGAPNFHVGIKHINNLGNYRDALDGRQYAMASVTRPQGFRVSKDPTDCIVKLQVQHRSYKNEWGVINRWVRFEVLERVCFCNAVSSV